MTLKARILLGTLVACACLLLAVAAWAADTLTVHASFTPDKLDAPTNLSITAKFVSSAGGPPSPVTKFTLYAPAGLGMDAHGAGTCTATELEEGGPERLSGRLPRGLRRRCGSARTPQNHYPRALHARLLLRPL